MTDPGGSMKRKPTDTANPPPSWLDLYPGIDEPPKKPFDAPLFQALVNRAMAKNWNKETSEELQEFSRTHYPSESKKEE